MLIFLLIIAAIFIILHLTKKLRFSSQFTMLLTVIGGFHFLLIYNPISKLLTDFEAYYNEKLEGGPISIAPSSTDNLLFIIFALILLAVVFFQLFYPHDPHSFGKQIYSEKGEKLIGGRRLVVTGIAASAVFMPTCLGWLVSTVFALFANFWGFMLALSLMPFFNFIFFQKEFVFGMVTWITSGVLYEYARIFLLAYAIGSVVAYIILTAGLIRTTLILTESPQLYNKRSIYLTFSTLPIINIFFGIFLIVKANKAIKAEKPVPVIHERKQTI